LSSPEVKFKLDNDS
jgi:exosome complex exonuclease DIS3/RRP44